MTSLTVQRRGLAEVTVLPGQDQKPITLVGLILHHQSQHLEFLTFNVYESVSHPVRPWQTDATFPFNKIQHC